MTILDYSLKLMQALKESGATCFLNAQTIPEINVILGSEQKAERTSRKRLNELVDAEYISKGAKKEHNYTYYLNRKGLDFLRKATETGNIYGEEGWT